MPTTVTQLIHSSFRLIGAIGAGETLETDELDDALVSLNQMVRSWNNEGASLPSRKRLTVAVTSSGGTYPLPERPMKIESASVSSGGIDSGLEIVDSAGWETTPEKQAQSVYVKRLFCDYAYPTATVYIAPVPRLPGLLELWVYVPLVAFAALDTEINLPDGYEIALRYNFAVALLPEYPRSQPDPTLIPQAQAYKQSIVQLNVSNHMHAAIPAPAAPAA